MDGKNLSLITYKKNGDSIATQVWFVEEAEKLYFVTLQGRYKFKRIQNNPNVKIAAASVRGKPKGDYLDGTARILSDEEFNRLIALFNKKYRMFSVMFKTDGVGEKKAYMIEITLK